MLKKWLPSLVGLSAFALFGRLLGFIREAIMASKFGANDITDAYLTILLLFDIAIAANTSILAGSLSYTSDSRDQNKHSYYFFKAGLRVLLILFIGALLISPVLEKIIPLIFTKSPASTEIILESARIFLVLAAFLVTSGIFSSILQMSGSITIPGKLIIFLNISSILFLILFSNSLGIISLPLGFLTGGVLFLAYQYILINKKVDVSRPAENDVKFSYGGWLIIVGMIFGNSLIPSMTGLIERYFAYDFTAGTFSHYQYAVKILLLPLTIVSFAISISLLPIQTKSIREGNEFEFRDFTNKGVLLSFLTSGFFAVLFYVLADPIIKVIYERGHFTPLDALETAHALRILSLELIPFLLLPVLANIFYSLKIIKYLVAINLSFILLQAGLLFWLSKMLIGIEALTISSVIIIWVNNISLILYLHARRKYSSPPGYILKFIKMIALTALIAVAGRLLFESWFINIPDGEKLIILYRGAVVVIVLIAAYSGLTALFFRDQLTAVISKLNNLRK